MAKGLPADGEGSLAELELAVEVAREAGRILMSYLGRRGEVGKKGVRELVTDADRASEAHIVASVKARFPDHAIYAEEGTQRDRSDGRPRWIVDPLDGTTNFVHQLPVFSVSLALERDGRIDVGVVYAPYVNELFFAARGKGAYLNSWSMRLHVTPARELIESVLATGFGYNLNDTPNTNLDNFATLTRLTRGLRRIGCASIDLAYVAAGRFDGFWELYLKPYDVAAGALLVEEAGGRVTDFAGGETWLEGQTIVASNGHLHEAIRTRLALPVDDGTLPLLPKS